MVKNVIIGSVPDRGSRANEMRPKPEKKFYGGGNYKGNNSKPHFNKNKNSK